MQKSFALLFLFAAFFLTGKPAQAQGTPYRLVIDMVSADTSDHAVILRQIRNLWKELPGTQVEIVMHGKALTMVQKDQAVMGDKIAALQKEGVVFAVCRNTMKRYNLAEKDFIPAATFVPAAIAELVKKQQEGWSYLKAGH
ncbi:DsrE family protein [Salmonirosea aquatica]